MFYHNFYDNLIVVLSINKKFNLLIFFFFLKCVLYIDQAHDFALRL